MQASTSGTNAACYVESYFWPLLFLVELYEHKFKIKFLKNEEDQIILSKERNFDIKKWMMMPTCQFPNGFLRSSLSTFFFKEKKLHQKFFLRYSSQFLLSIIQCAVVMKIGHGSVFFLLLNLGYIGRSQIWT